MNLGNVRSLAEPPPATLAVFPPDGSTDLIDTDELGEALAQLRQSAPSARMSCSPDLAEAAEPLGYEVVPWTFGARAERAALALLLSAGMPYVDLADRASIVGLVRAAARLVTVAKDRDRFWRIEAAVQGTDSAGKISTTVSVIASTSPDPEKINVTVFSSRADADAYWQSVSTPPGRPAPIGYVTLDLTRAYTHALRTALELFTDQTWAPSAAVTDGDTDRNLSDLEAMMLAAIAFTVADLAEHPDEPACETVFAERDVTLLVKASAQNTPPSASRYRGSQGWWT
ncbi:hypothetical protein [Sorangium sp. So ce385]|uniref:hypothetical protein n=1 Tax=Sorangium sp. So ce385 TaxID=3133308 RepID=UPI003F5AE336